MSRENLIEQGKLAYESLSNIDKATLLNNPNNLQPWQGLDFNDFVESFNDMLLVLEGIYSNDVLDNSPFNIINSVNSQLKVTLQHCNAFIGNRAQAQFQNAFQHIENVRTHIQQWGLKYEAVLGKDIEERSKLIDDEIKTLLSNKSEIDALKSSVNSLIEPAVAGSLSKAFADRKTVLHTNQNRWFWASVISAVMAIVATIVIVSSIVGIFASDELIKAIESGKNGTNGLIWTTVGLRIGMLFPIYSIFAFAFVQYKKERDLEEEYAHKAAVATSLPNYGSLAVENDVKDQILSEASKVIFTSPSSKDKKIEKEETIGVSQLNGLLTNIQKLVPKSST